MPEKFRQGALASHWTRWGLTSSVQWQHCDAAGRATTLHAGVPYLRANSSPCCSVSGPAFPQCCRQRQLKTARVVRPLQPSEAVWIMLQAPSLSLAQSCSLQTTGDGPGGGVAPCVCGSAFQLNKHINVSKTKVICLAVRCKIMFCGFISVTINRKKLFKNYFNIKNTCF